jgi:ribosome biogenesis protein BRX1
MFGVPRLARRSKPFIDHVISFSILDNKIWFRNYQIIEKDPGKGSLAEVEEGEGKKRKSKGSKGEEEPPTLVEIGPRMVLTPIRIFEGSFGGATVYENPGEMRLTSSPQTIEMHHLTLTNYYPFQNTFHQMLLDTM